MAESLSCVWLDTMNYSLPGSSVHEIFQARTLEWAAIYQPRSPALQADFYIAGRFLTDWAMREVLQICIAYTKIFTFLVTKNLGELSLLENSVVIL